MFKHILIPTDGSELSAKAIRAGVRLAAEMGARVTAVYAEEPVRGLHLQNYHALEKELAAEFDRRLRELAERCTAQVEAEAKAAGVPCEPVVVKAESPHEAIVQTARARGCDAIFMASHGHKGLKGLLLGSVTQQVLAHSDVPVLVFR